MRPLLLCLLLAPLPAAAQVYLGAEVGPDAFTRPEEAKIDTTGEDAYAWALSVDVSSAALYAVFGSTSPEREMLKYLRQGIYRRELAALMLLSERTSVPFKKLAAELPAAGGLRGLARRHKADAMALFEEGGRLQAEAEARMPLFLISVSTSVELAGAVTPSTAPPSGKDPHEDAEP